MVKEKKYPGITGYCGVPLYYGAMWHHDVTFAMASCDPVTPWRYENIWRSMTSLDIETSNVEANTSKIGPWRVFTSRNYFKMTLPCKLKNKEVPQGYSLIWPCLSRSHILSRSLMVETSNVSDHPRNQTSNTSTSPHLVSWGRFLQAPRVRRAASPAARPLAAP